MDICTILIILYVNMGSGGIQYPPEIHPMVIQRLMRKAERCYLRWERQQEPFEPIFA